MSAYSSGHYLAEPKETNMPAWDSSTSPEEILRKLLELARATWGEERAQEIQATLENASRQLSEVSNNLPDKETERDFTNNDATGSQYCQ